MEMDVCIEVFKVPLGVSSMLLPMQMLSLILIVRKDQNFRLYSSYKYDDTAKFYKLSEFKQYSQKKKSK
jgi:hypothetical protein